MKILKKQWLIFKKSKDKMSVFMFASFLGYFIYTIFKIPIVSLVFVIIGVVMYFTIYRQNRYFKIRHKVMWVFSRLSINLGQNNLENRDIILFLMSDYAKAQSNFEDMTVSLKTDLENLAHFRYKILKYADNKTFFKALCSLAIEIETILEEKHHFYNMRIYFYNRRNVKEFRRRANDVIEEANEFERLLKLFNIK